MSESRNRVSNRLFSTEKRSKFNQSFRKASLANAQKRRDEETRRMEEYRRLCQREGIASARLAEYDAKKAAANQVIDEALAKVRDDITLSNAQKKKMVFSIKRKAAARDTLTEVPTESHVAAKLKAAEAKREEEERAKQAERQAKEDARRAARNKRSDSNKLFSQRTSKGQPVMKSRIQALLTRIEQSSSS